MFQLGNKITYNPGQNAWDTLFFLQKKHFTLSSLTPLNNVGCQESQMCHKYSTVKGLQHGSGGAGDKSFKGYLCDCKLLASRSLHVKKARTKGSVPNPFGQDC